MFRLWYPRPAPPAHKARGVVASGDVSRFFDHLTNSPPKLVLWSKNKQIEASEEGCAWWPEVALADRVEGARLCAVECGAIASNGCKSIA